MREININMYQYNFIDFPEYHMCHINALLIKARPAHYGY